MKKRLLRRLALALVPPLGAFLMRIIFFTCKKIYNIPDNLPKEPFIVAFWHGELLMEPFLYQKIRGDHPIAVMISEHFDGELIARTIGYFGFEAIRGSSKKGGAKVLIQALKRLKAGSDVAITPDGPRGPRHSVAPGIAILSQKSDAYIVPFSYSASKYWQLRSWDRFIIPKPFSTLHFRVGEPFKLAGMDEERARREVKRRLEALSENA